MATFEDGSTLSHDTVLRFDNRRVAALDGVWDFFPGDHPPAAAGGPGATDPGTITVPGLWEAQGHLDLDGVAWYRRTFRTDDHSGHWTLRFGAVMDLCDVYLNGRLLGSNDLPFTPFEFDAAPALLPGDNELAVRVVDPAVGDPEHLVMPHGKQGWAGEVFPSPPSLYLTYGGIWQSVTLRRHGPVAITDVFVNGDPDALTAKVELENRGPETDVLVEVRTLGEVRQATVRVPAGARSRVEVPFGSTTADRWSPEHPVLQEALVDARVDGALTDSTTVRYGLRTVRVEGSRLLLNGEQYRMKSVLVQGFRADTLYAERDRDHIRQEVAAAVDMGFNTVRLHIKAFDPSYLEVCDEMGMLVHCDIPVAEPLAHEQLGEESVLGRRCVAAARAQVRRDRNHPSVVLWTAMNEICVDHPDVRRGPQYEAFARALAGVVSAEDPTRPVVENDWIDPDPEHVFVSAILTAHWYGRLHREYLDHLEAACQAWKGLDRPLLVTEFGDWGLPPMTEVPEPPFWDPQAQYRAAVAETRWPGSIESLVTGTQRYQGLSDRLQAEVFRRHDHVGGYCVTELTDVPHELNGLLDLHRRPKPPAVAELARANQVVLPMLTIESLAVPAGGTFSAPLHIVNDGPTLSDVTVVARLGAEVTHEVQIGRLDGYAVVSAGPLQVTAPEVPGGHDLVLTLRRGESVVAENRYPIQVVDNEPTLPTVRLVGGGITEGALSAMGAMLDPDGLTVIGEDALDATSAAEAAKALADGRVVLVLAQPPSAAAHYPVPVVFEELATAWGSTVFRLTTDSGAIGSLPRRAVLVTEDLTIQPACVASMVGEHRFPDTPVVIAYKPAPGGLTGTVVGAHQVGSGRLVMCQYRLATRVSAADPTARAVLADVLNWAGTPPAAMNRERSAMPDGRHLVRYSWEPRVAG